MKDSRLVFLDGATKYAVTLVDATAAAQALARGHLAGPTAAHYLAQALAGVALLGAETSAPEETVTFRFDGPGALAGFLVEATEKGTLRGYTKKKILPDFDGISIAKPAEALGETGTFEVIRSVPGSILSSASVAVAKPTVAGGLDAYAAQSLQRRVKTAVMAAVSDDGEVTMARGVSVECPPDGDPARFDALKMPADLSVAPRTLLKKLGFPQAEKREETPIAFACRCSAGRAADILAALPAAERAQLPESVDITCHMCGRTWTVRT